MRTISTCPGYSLRSALSLLGIARSTWHYRHRPRARAARPIPHTARAQPTALSTGERAVIAEAIIQGWAQGASVANTFASLWSRGQMLGSLSTWMRIARTLDDTARPRVRAKRAQRVPVPSPVVFASGPDQAWCWDITLLPGPFVGQRFHAYSVMDLYSRKIVGFAVHDCEQDVLAREVFEQAITDAGGVVPAVVHSDSGSAMRSRLLTGYLKDLGVRMSFNRPRVSNDNAFKESEFRTMKYRPGAPSVFASLEQAREFVASHVAWYNEVHCHRGVGLFTPQEVYSGAWKRSHQMRERAVRSYALSYPGRFGRGGPVVVKQPGWAGINAVCPELGGD